MLTRIALFIVLSVLSLQAYAQSLGGACTTTGQIATVAANGFYNILYCNGATWVLSSIKAGTSASTTCTANETGLLQIAANQNLEFCNGTGWQQFEFYPNYTPPTQTGTSGIGYLVLGNDTYDGNLGGMEGANAKCVTELTTYNWLGKTDATSRGLMNYKHIFALICESSSIGTCINPIPLTTYKFARANDITAGGASFTTNGAGWGPGDAGNWSGSTYFNGTFRYWTGRFANGGNQTWAAGVSGDTTLNQCGATATEHWQTNNASYSGRTGTSSSTASPRYYDTTQTCNTLQRLICFVNP